MRPNTRRFPRFFMLLAAFALCLFIAPAAAQTQPSATTAPAADGKLRVLVKPAEPFSFVKNGKITGYSVELWERVAEEAGLQFKLEMVETVPQLLTALQKKEADAGVGAISITEDREKVIDFSNKIFDSGLQILAPGQGGGSAFAAFGALFRGDVLLVVGVFLLAIFLVSNILWFFERKANAECFPEGYKSGVWEACWWAACTIISGGCENKAANTVPGRLVAIVWMLGGIGLTSYITATLASAMTVNTLNSDIHSVADLKGQVIGTAGGSSTENYLTRQGFKPRTFKNVETAIDALAKGDLKAVVYDSPMLRYYLAKNANSPLQLAGEVFDEQDYGFALPLGSPHRKAINAAFLKLKDEGFVMALEKKWFSAKAE